MPLPKPEDNEKEDEFIGRCMGMKVMKDDFADEKQRLAVCYSQWRKEKESLDDDKEYRTYPLEIRKTKEGHLIGYASIFDSWSQDLGGFREIVRPGAFTKTIQELKSDIRALFNHDPNYVLGRNTASTLSLKEDVKGLNVDIVPPNTQWAKDLEVSMDRGDINQMSFGFRTIKDNWIKEDDENKRELLEVSLHNGDVSIVTYPAYEKTRISAKRTLDKHLAEEPAVDHSSDSVKQAESNSLAEKKRKHELLGLKINF